MLEDTIKNLEKSIVNLDVICLTETFIKKGSESNLLLKNYFVATAYSRANERRGGSCILLRKGLEFTLLPSIKPESLVFEICALEVVSAGITIICIYRTPTSNPNTFLVKLNELLCKLSRSKKQLILCGDWNIDVLKESKISKELISLMNNHNLINHINLPTRKKACIDLIVSGPVCNPNSKIHLTCLSDHETGQSLSVDVKNNDKYQKLPYYFESRRDMCAENQRKFVECLSCLGFADVTYL